ncbi:MAG: hypothetical protein HYS17_05975 [Micavibrio aeruginosavorus]|uniref:Uncharacterized protein n=1 Tax=Micavibrio aeruginosavorus TaxID=349221 RepID=A0A7T5UHV6_9BACT|nr:MAG: hypothetical protein HYS17_05975 [Micavibrio aeruginosavorus]
MKGKNIKRCFFATTLSLVAAVLLIEINIKSPQKIPCEQDVSYDCVARELFDLLPEKQNTYELFNQNLREVLYFFYEVEDKKLLNDVLAQFEEIERNGVIDAYDKRSGRGSGLREPSLKMEKAYFFLALDRYERALEIVSEYSRDQPLQQREETIIGFLVKSRKYDEGLQRLESFFDAGYQGSDVVDAPAFTSQMLYKLFFGFLGKGEYSKAEYVILLIEKHPDHDDWTMSAYGAYMKLLAKKFDNKEIRQEDVCREWKHVWMRSASSRISVDPFVKYNCFLSDRVARELVKQASIRQRNFYNLAVLGEDAEIKRIIADRQELAHKYRDHLGAAEVYFTLDKSDVAYQYIELAKSLIPEIYKEYRNEKGWLAPECQAQAVGIVLRDWVSYQAGNDFIHKYSCAKPHSGVSDILGRRMNSMDHFLPAYEERLQSGTTNPSLLRPFIELFARHGMYDKALHVVELYQSSDMNALYKARSHDYLEILAHLLWANTSSETSEGYKSILWRGYMANCMSIHSDLKSNAGYLNSEYYRRRSCYVKFLAARQNFLRT